jgi:hypothetical protein
MNPIIWVLIACFAGSLLGYISKWLSGGIVGWKAFAQDVLTGLIAAAVFAGAYQINQGGLTVLDILGAVVAGWGIVMGVNSVKSSAMLKKLNKTTPAPYQNKMNQPK